MTYHFGTGLQAAVYRALMSDPVLQTLVGAAIHDAPLDLGTGIDAPSEYVTLGEETVLPNDTKTSTGSIHDFEIVVNSARDGFDTIKRISAAICDRLVDGDLALENGRIVGLRFRSARATRGAAPVKRRIALRFRAVIDQD